MEMIIIRAAAVVTGLFGAGKGRKRKDDFESSLIK